MGYINYSYGGFSDPAINLQLIYSWSSNGSWNCTIYSKIDSFIFLRML